MKDILMEVFDRTNKKLVVIKLYIVSMVLAFIFVPSVKTYYEHFYFIGYKSIFSFDEYSYDDVITVDYSLLAMELIALTLIASVMYLYVTIKESSSKQE